MRNNYALQLIEQYNLQPCDAVELVSFKTGFPKHYAIYLGNSNGKPHFIANITNGVQIIKEARLEEFMVKYGIQKIERFYGTEEQRKKLVKKATSRLGERNYNLIFNNCEHFKNWVLYNASKSKQVLSIGAGVGTLGLFMLLAGVGSQRKGLQKAGLALLIPVVLIVLAFILIVSNKET